MPMTVLATKLYLPLPPPTAIARGRLIERLDAGLAGKLTLVCAPAGFGKSTVLAAWLEQCPYPGAWVSLDSADSDPTVFLAYLLAALQTIDGDLGAGLAARLQAAPAPTSAAILTVLINDLAASQARLVLVLDDYHLAASAAVDAAVTFLLEHMPAQLHLVLASRSEPALALGRLRLQGQLHELREADLRFDGAEAAAFLGAAMGLRLAAPQVAALTARTEGWVAGLQLAALSLRHHPDPGAFIDRFGGAERHLQDYLLEQVLQQQSPQVQAFLLHSAVLERFCAPLCDAALAAADSAAMIATLARANLFMVPLDGERRWYRYHHLFADLLRARLATPALRSAILLRASSWYEAEGRDVEAFEHAVAAADVARARRLMDGAGMPLYFRGETGVVLRWLQAQPAALLDGCPALWVAWAWALFISGQSSPVEARLLAAEHALGCAGVTVETSGASDVEAEVVANAAANVAANVAATLAANMSANMSANMDTDPASTDLRGQIAALRAWVAVSRNDAAAIHDQASRALVLLAADNRAARTAAHCALGVALLFRQQRAAARAAFAQVITQAQSNGNRMFTVAASIALAGLEVAGGQLRLAAATYRGALALVADPADLIACEAHLGLARILYEFNELDDAEAHAARSSALAARADSENGLGAEALRARLLLLRGDSDGAVTLLEAISTAAKSRRHAGRMQEIASVQVQALLQRGETSAAAFLASQHQLPLAQARTRLAQGEGSAALDIVVQYGAQMQAQGRQDEVLRALVLQALILHASGSVTAAMTLLDEALVLAEPHGWTRLFLDEGAPMAQLLAQLAQLARQGGPGRPVPAGPTARVPDYVTRLLGLLALQQPMRQAAARPASRVLAVPAETYSKRELEILRLIHQGRSNQEIGALLFLSLSTVKWHNQNIFAKLQVQRRTEAVARAIELQLVSP